ncbi:MAG: hypothetical protein J7521_22295 [Caulobacter sp.]|nr:hypothetical protein [Caulobacter sp.]
MTRKTPKPSRKPRRAARKPARSAALHIALAESIQRITDLLERKRAEQRDVWNGVDPGQNP